MAGDMTRKQLAGAPLQLPAKLMSDIIDASRRRPEFDLGAKAAQHFPSTTIIKVRNDSGRDLDRRAILGLGAPLILPAANEPEFISEVWLAGELPDVDTHRGKFCVLLDPIPNGGIGRAIVAGVTQAMVVGAGLCVGATVDVETGVTDYLTARVGGAAQVLWVGNNNSAETWAVVRLGNGPLSFFARILSRTAVTCGNSGSGSGDTDHTTYTYAIHSVRAIDDGDGCPTFVDDDIETALTGTAYEVNGNRVAVGTIVSVESVVYTDEQVSGSGSGMTGPAGCRLVFEHEAETVEVPLPAPSYRYLCVAEDGVTPSSVQTEWLVGANGTLTYVRDTGVCCDCESGSGCNSELQACLDWWESPPVEMCFTLAYTGSTACLNGDAIQIPLSCQGTCSNTNSPPTSLYWAGSDIIAGTTFGHEGRLSASYDKWACKITWRIDFCFCCLPGCCTGGTHGDCKGCCGWAIAISDCPPTFPLTFINFSFNVANCPDAFSSATGTLNIGQCDPESGSGGGGGACPCAWRWASPTALVWNYVSGAGCTAPAPVSRGAAVGEVRYFNTDGTACDPDVIPCNCDAGSRTATWTNTTGWVAACSQLVASGTLVSETTCIWQSHSLGCCGQEAKLLFWCEAGRLYATIEGTGVAFEAEPGSTLTNATFNMSFPTSNTLCPGQTGGGTVSIVT